MKYKYEGNLAYQVSDENRVEISSDSLRSSAFPNIPYELPDFPERRKEELEREQRRIRREEEARDAVLKRIHKNVGAERLKTLIYCISCLALIAGMFAFLLIRQSTIVEQNFQNTRMKNQINEINAANVNEYDMILSQVNMSEIEQQALSLFGLRKPAQAQRIHLNLPKTDRVIRHEQKTHPLTSENPEENVFDASQIELYMNTLRLQD